MNIFKPDNNELESIKIHNQNNKLLVQIFKLNKSIKQIIIFIFL